MSTYLGYDLLEAASHNMRESIRESFTRKGSLLGGGTGKRSWVDFAGQAFPVRSFTWSAFGRAGVYALDSFYLARKGQLYPFWTSSYGGEIALAADAVTGASSLVVKAIGFTRFLYPLAARRYLAVSRADQSLLPLKITSAVDNGDGTETLVLSAPLAEDVPAVRMISFLPLCRLELDEVTIHRTGTEFAEGTFLFRELPLEVPV